MATFFLHYTKRTLAFRSNNRHTVIGLMYVIHEKEGENSGRRRGEAGKGVKEQSKIQVLPNIGGEKTGFSSV